MSQQRLGRVVAGRGGRTWVWEWINVLKLSCTYFISFFITRTPDIFTYAAARLSVRNWLSPLLLAQVTFVTALTGLRTKGSIGLALDSRETLKCGLPTAIVHSLLDRNVSLFLREKVHGDSEGGSCFVTPQAFVHPKAPALILLPAQMRSVKQPLIEEFPATQSRAFSCWSDSSLSCGGKFSYI